MEPHKRVVLYSIEETSIGMRTIFEIASYKIEGTRFSEDIVTRTIFKYYNCCDKFSIWKQHSAIVPTSYTLIYIIPQKFYPLLGKSLCRMEQSEEGWYK